MERPINLVTDREPLAYDFDANPPARPLPPGEPFKNAFRRGDLSFNDELLDMVAMIDGLDEDNCLNMPVLTAVEAVLDYVEGRQGEPFVMAETFYIGDAFGRLDTVVGILGQEQKIAGVFQGPAGRRARYSGLKVSGEPREVAAYATDQGLRLDNVSLPVPEVVSGVLPFVTPYFKLGRPSVLAADPRNSRSKQEIVAGDDILPWIKESFTSEVDQYTIVCGIARALQSKRASQYILRPPYSDKLALERSTLETIAETLSAARDQITQHEEAIVNVREDATRSLAGIKETLGALAYRLPYTRGGDVASVVAPVDAGSNLGSRLRAIANLQKQLAELTDSTD
ncbi:MAG: hypothetical protein JWM81_241 [Candidatus Saccharibacteria bacterium]|nr:hypothetical protein [Candidatus Saccharibacteria bacterium]